jgi:hypothetical protein
MLRPVIGLILYLNIKIVDCSQVASIAAVYASWKPCLAKLQLENLSVVSVPVCCGDE